MQILAAVIGATILVVPLLVRSQRRGWLRVESWRCPACGSAFGAQRQRRFWSVRRDPHIAGLPTGGPIVRCPSCQREFAFDGDGRQVDYHREYVEKAV